MSLQSRQIQLSGQGAGAGAATNLLQVQNGLDDYATWDLTARFSGDTGGTNDVYLQTQDYPGGPWSDIAHFPQLAANAAAVAYRVVFKRGIASPVTAIAPTVVNPTDGTPTMTVNTYLPWANGASVRLVIVEGAGCVSKPLQNITGIAIHK